MSDKATNPKDAIGSDKLPLHLWPESATAFGCIGMANGMLKYGRSNWREAGIRPSIYADAAKRHITDYMEGNDYDPEDGVHNLSAALACLAILVDATVTDQINDDRNYNGKGWRKARAMMEPHLKRLKELHKDRSPKHWTIQDNPLTGDEPFFSDGSSLKEVLAAAASPKIAVFPDSPETTPTYMQEFCGENNLHHKHFFQSDIHSPMKECRGTF